MGIIFPHCFSHFSSGFLSRTVILCDTINIIGITITVNNYWALTAARHCVDLVRWLSYLILDTTLRARHFYHFWFADEEIVAQRSYSVQGPTARKWQNNDTQYETPMSFIFINTCSKVRVWLSLFSWWGTCSLKRLSSASQLLSVRFKLRSFSGCFFFP